MKKQLFGLLALLFCLKTAFAQDTFSIVAVDSTTGEIGSAGASCIDEIGFPGSNGAIIISDIIAGRGAIHTQSYWNFANQVTARAKMEDGLAPQEIMDFLATNAGDAQSNPKIRQYGAVDFDPSGSPRAAGFTGVNCFDYKNHVVGKNYSIQGNILLGQQILDSMEVRFLNTPGPLADRLMAALQGANVVGADTRCTNNGTSSLSAFLRVAQPNDPDGEPSLSLNVPSLPAGQEPIDSLQTLFDAWKITAASEPKTGLQPLARVFPNPSAGDFFIENKIDGARLRLFNSAGKPLFETVLSAGRQTLSTSRFPQAGFYFLKLETPDGKDILAEKLFFQK